MAHGDWNPSKITAMGLISIIVALATGLVVANWTAPGPGEEPAVTKRQPPAAPRAASAPAPRAQVAPPAAPTPRAQAEAPAAPAPRIPTQAAIEACNQQAADRVGPRDKTLGVVKDGVIGAVAGAADVAAVPYHAERVRRGGMS